MARRLLLLATLAAAGASLAACDNPAAGILSTAEKGQCFAVTGKDSLGQPKLIRTDCAAPGAVAARPAVPVQTAAACMPAKPVAAPPPCATGVTHSAAPTPPRARKAARVVRKAVRHRGKVHYEYVPASGEVFTSSSSYEYARPSETTELAGAYSYHREEAYVAPPPPPPPRVHAERQYESSQSESRSYSSQSSSSSSYASSSQARRKPCNCRRDGRPVAPRYERDGYLTWPGKSPY